jgi:undecaprenyl diphosphate synthase
MDGNARWAKKRTLPIAMGHKSGSDAVKTLVNSCLEFKIKYLTIYAFSTENWQRPKKEVDYLMSLFRELLNSQLEELMKKKVRVVISGSFTNIDEVTKKRINEIEKATQENNSLILNIAFDYGSKREITDAVRKIVLDLQDNKIIFDQINEELISRNLYHSWIPDPELVIRTAGEKRLSNFLLWQASYSELYFTEKLWPDFNKEDLFQAILDFNKRERRYGKR